MSNLQSSPAHALHRAGRLNEAIQVLVAEVKSRPADVRPRSQLAEFLCIAGELERAEQQLDTCARLDPGVGVGAGLLKALVLADRWRQQFHSEGRVPEFLARPSERMQLHLRASIHLREAQPERAAELLAQAEDQRPHLHGNWNGEPFDDFRDLDDLVSSVLEVLTPTGKYYWIPLEDVRAIQLHKPARPIDLFWPRATVGVEAGPEGDVYLPAIYAPYTGGSSEAHQLGRATDWASEPGHPVLGRGLRTFLLGEETRVLLELGALQLSASA